MADNVYGAFTASPDNVINKHAAVGVESVTSNFEYITITTNVDIRMSSQSGGSSASQANLDKLIEIISLRGQPVIMGSVSGTSRFALTVANEHNGAWQQTATSGVYPVDPRSGEDLKSRIIADGVNYGFGVDMTGSGGVNDSSGGTGGGLTVAFSNVLV